MSGRWLRAAILNRQLGGCGIRDDWYWYLMAADAFGLRVDDNWEVQGGDEWTVAIRK